MAKLCFPMFPLENQKLAPMTVKIDYISILHSILYSILYTIIIYPSDRKLYSTTIEKEYMSHTEAWESTIKLVFIIFIRRFYESTPNCFIYMNGCYFVVMTIIIWFMILIVRPVDCFDWLVCMTWYEESMKSIEVFERINILSKRSNLTSSLMPDQHHRW